MAERCWQAHKQRLGARRLHRLVSQPAEAERRGLARPAVEEALQRSGKRASVQQCRARSSLARA